MNAGESLSRRKKWVRALALLFGLWLAGAGVLHVIHGDYAMAPPSFIVAALLVCLGLRPERKAAAG